MRILGELRGSGRAVPRSDTRGIRRRRPAIPGTTAAAAALAALATAAPAAAQSEPPRQTYSDRFTTDVPGAPAGRTYAIDWTNPADPDGKPHSFSRLRVELAEGARLDTSALPFCEASDAELMAAGPGACPAHSRVGTDETLLDTGFPGPGRYVTSDFTFFNNRDELILVATVRETGTRVVLRGRVGERTLDIDVPMLPGTPPDGAAARRQRGRFDPPLAPLAGRQSTYLTTPPTCPARGYWVTRVTYTYRDGVEQTAESRSPCRRAGGQSRPSDDRPPKVRAAGIPRSCATRSFRARIGIGDASRLRSVSVRVDRRRIATSRRKRFGVTVAVRGLRAGRHTLRVTAVDVAGNRTERGFSFRRCGAIRLAG